jgi:hypothetical protein
MNSFGRYFLERFSLQTYFELGLSLIAIWKCIVQMLDFNQSYH